MKTGRFVAGLCRKHGNEVRLGFPRFTRNKLRNNNPIVKLIRKRTTRTESEGGVDAKD